MAMITSIVRRARHKAAERLWCLFNENGSTKRLISCSRVENVSETPSGDARDSEKIDFGESVLRKRRYSIERVGNKESFGDGKYRIQL
jgi:hypothetical protein